MLESFNSDKLSYQKLSAEEMQKRGILGRLAGVVADFKNPTRNGRLYSESLWDKTFEDPIMQEKIKNRCLFGELGHPADRLEVDMEKVAICMAEQPKKGNDGKLYSVFDILDTPNGRILKTLCDYGCTIGVSSRGNGELETDFDGNESVIPDTYQCECWDAVLIPAVESARMTYVTESLGNKTFKQALNESLEKASPEEKKVMEETLQNLNIDYSDSKKEESNNIESTAAKDNGADFIKSLQEAILAKEQAEAKITELQEKLSVCYAKETSLEEDLNKYKGVIRNLSESNSKLRKLEDEIKALNEQLVHKDALLKEEKEKTAQAVKRQSLNENKQINLKESLSEKTAQLENANQKVKQLTERLQVNAKKFTEEKQQLTENYEHLKKDYTIKQTEYTRKLSQSNKLVEQYRNTAQKAVDKYIESKALTIGVSLNEIKNQLPKNYSFSDIDLICEKLGDYKLQLNNLPFDIKSVRNVSITESQSKKLPGSNNFIDDSDDVTDVTRLAKKLL